MKWNVFCNENAPYRIYYRQIEIDGYEMYVMFPLPMTGMECGWAVSHGATTVESRVKQVETQIRLFLHTPEIENEIKDIETAHLNEEGGFDCGFIFWYPKADSQLEKDMSLLVGANRRKLSWLDIAVPTFSQSINVQRYGAELIKKLVKERLGIELYYRSELD